MNNARENNKNNILYNSHNSICCELCIIKQKGVNSMERRTEIFLGCLIIFLIISSLLFVIFKTTGVNGVLGFLFVSLVVFMSIAGVLFITFLVYLGVRLIIGDE